MAPNANRTLCYKTGDRAWERFGHLPYDQYPRASRVVVLVQFATGIIENGGFEYLFEGSFPGDPDFSLTIESFREINANEAAEILQKACSLIPREVLVGPDDARIDYFNQVPLRTRNKMARSFWASTGKGKLDDLLAAFIRKHHKELK